MQKFTLHTHTSGFDGRNTAAEMVAQARSLGMDAIGISNHFIVHRAIKFSNMYPYAVRGGYDTIYASSFDEALGRFAPHYANLSELARASDIRVLRGMEVDFFDEPEWYRGFRRAVRFLQPDYIIGSAHFVNMGGRLYNAYDIKNANPQVKEKMLKQYWTNVRNAGRSGLFTWLAHLDLPRKVGAGTESKWQDVESWVITDLAISGAKTEINTSAMSCGLDEPYPSSRILKMVAEHKIPVLISDDAHCANDIGRQFSVAEQFAGACGIDRLAQLGDLIRQR